MNERLILNAVGDVSLGDHPVCVGHGMRTAFARRGDKILRDVNAILTDADHTMGNLETVAANTGLKGYWLPSYEMRGQPSALSHLCQAGFDTLGVANNHTMQHGLTAFNDTVENLRRLDFNVLGVDEPAGITTPVYFGQRGVSACALAVSMRPEKWTSGAVPYSHRQSEARLLEEIRNLRRHHDGFLILSIHWGLELLSYPAPSQAELAHRLIEAGVDVILGHHSHVLQPVEEYRTGLIFYSLGNFTFDLWEPDTKLSVIARLTLKSTQRPAYELIPVAIDESFAVRLANAEQRRKIYDRMSYEHLQAQTPHISEDEYQAAYSRLVREGRPVKYRYFYHNRRLYSFNFLGQSLARTVLRRLTGR